MLLTRQITVGAISSAMILGTITLSSLLPIGDFALYAFSSLMIAFSIIKAGLKTGMITYVTSGILLTFLLGFHYSVPFFAFFGIYPIIKGIAEKNRKHFLVFLVKGIYFIVVIGITMLLFREVFTTLTYRIAYWTELIRFPLSVHVGILLMMCLIGGFLFDHILSLMIELFIKRAKKMNHPSDEAHKEHQDQQSE